jgi:hypothetical protein
MEEAVFVYLGLVAMIPLDFDVFIFLEKGL